MISIREAAKIAAILRAGDSLGTPHDVALAARCRRGLQIQVSEEELLEVGNAFAASVAANIRHRRAELRLPASKFEAFCRSLDELAPGEDVPLDELEPIAEALKINAAVLIMHNAFNPEGDPSDLLDA